jgi:CHAT domain-containing protein
MRRARVSRAVGTLGTSDDVAVISTVAAALPDETVLLEYALGDSASFVWVVDRKGHDLVRLPSRPIIEAEVLRLRDALARVQGGEDALRKSARSLYETLVRPVAARLKDAEAVLIVPDGRLFDLPFEVLLSSDAAAGDDWRKQPYFARSHETLYAPSATVYVAMKSRPAAQSYDHDLFAVGNPDFSELALQGGKPLAPLPFAKQEVDAISARIKDSRKTVLTGREASEANVKHEFKNGTPRVVHLATHGLVDPVEPVRSNVALTPGDHEDGYFHTLEILATPVRCQLVVMSACESARGQISRGEGVVGLSRAFLASGAGSVVASLWAVSDESTAELMRAFYERMLGKKRSASRALNEARLALIDSEKYSHPFFWSPFVVTGTERAPW